MRAYTLTSDTCRPGIPVTRLDPPQLVFHRTPTLVQTTIGVDPPLLVEDGQLVAASIGQSDTGLVTLGPEQPHDDGWLLLVDAGAGADTDTFGFVDLVVQQA